MSRMPHCYFLGLPIPNWAIAVHLPCKVTWRGHDSDAIVIIMNVPSNLIDWDTFISHESSTLLRRKGNTVVHCSEFNQLSPLALHQSHMTVDRNLIRHCHLPDSQSPLPAARCRLGCRPYIGSSPIRAMCMVDSFWGRWFVAWSASNQLKKDPSLQLQQHSTTRLLHQDCQKYMTSCKLHLNSLWSTEFWFVSFPVFQQALTVPQWRLFAIHPIQR